MICVEITNLYDVEIDSIKIFLKLFVEDYKLESAIRMKYHEVYADFCTHVHID